MSIFLVRHGETEGNASRVLQRADTPLNALGMQQAERLALRLAGEAVARVVVSDLERARMTAAAITRRIGLPAHESPLLAERSFGDLRGTPYDALPGDPFAPDFAPPNGETWDVFHARVADAFRWVLEQASLASGHIVVVTHGLVCRALAQQHLTLSREHSLPGRFSNTSVTIFDADAPHAVSLLDCTVHLDEHVRPSDRGGAA